MSPREQRIERLRVVRKYTVNADAKIMLASRIALYEVMTDDEYDEFERRLIERADNRATD